jgi:hypothetical protein
MVQHSYDLKMGESVGPIRFGESRQSLIQKLGQPEKTRTTRLSIKDWYFDIGLSVEYRPSDDACSHITVLSSASLIYEGNDLLRLSWGELVSWLYRLDPAAQEVGLGYESWPAGISIYFKFNEDDSLRIVDLINAFDPQYRATDEEIAAEVQRQIAEMPSEEECLIELGIDAAVLQSLYTKEGLN